MQDREWCIISYIWINNFIYISYTFQNDVRNTNAQDKHHWYINDIPQEAALHCRAIWTKVFVLIRSLWFSEFLAEFSIVNYAIFLFPEPVGRQLTERGPTGFLGSSSSQLPFRIKPDEKINIYRTTSMKQYWPEKRQKVLSSLSEKLSKLNDKNTMYTVYYIDSWSNVLNR